MHQAGRARGLQGPRLATSARKQTKRHWVMERVLGEQVTRWETAARPPNSNL